MANMIFINPSTNIFQLSDELIKKGNKVLLFNNREIPSIIPDSVIYFYDKTTTVFSEQSDKNYEKEDMAFLFKSKFFARLRMLTLSRNLSYINRELSNGDFNDLVLFKSKTVIKPDNTVNLRSFDNLQEVTATYPRHTIYTSAIKEPSTTTLTYHSSDYDFKSAFGNDYIILLSNHMRVELFVYKSNLITISKSKKPIDLMIRLFPTLSKFKFEVNKSFNISFNRMPFVNTEYSTKAILLNDYSFGRTSIKMNKSFYEKLSDHLIAPK